MISQETLKEFFNYDPDTGLFSVVKPRKSAAGKFRIPGQVVGTLKNTGYLKISIQNKHEYLHRLAFLYMVGEIPECIDHINGDPKDNRWANLRGCTKQQNSANLKVTKSLSGYKGTTKVNGRYRAQITHKNKNKHLGYFDTAEQAHSEYMRVSKELNGQFANPGGVCV